MAGRAIVAPIMPSGSDIYRAREGLEAAARTSSWNFHPVCRFHGFLRGLSFAVDGPPTPFFWGRRPIHPIPVRRVTLPGCRECGQMGRDRRGSATRLELTLLWDAHWRDPTHRTRAAAIVDEVHETRQARREQAGTGAGGGESWPSWRATCGEISGNSGCQSGLCLRFGAPWSEEILNALPAAVLDHGRERHERPLSVIGGNADLYAVNPHWLLRCLIFSAICTRCTRCSRRSEGALCADRSWKDHDRGEAGGATRRPDRA
jgi:hypothetical protein